jgi:ABC-2 type transport system permease protein
MNVLSALLRRHWIESRWVLIVSASAFLAMAILTSWVAKRIEGRIEAAAETGEAPKGIGPVRALGGPAMDFSSTALQVCFWNHPVVVLTILSWAINRGALSAASEIERGTVDLTLSRPVSRSIYLTSHVIYFLIGMLVLAAALVAGDLVGSMVFHLKSPPSILTLLKPAWMVVTLGMSVYGYTLPISTVDVVRWRATLGATAITLLGLTAMTLAATLDLGDFEWIDRLSVFRAYAPVTVALKGEPLAYNSTVLLLVFTAGLGMAYPLFIHRDIPSNS